MKKNLNSSINFLDNFKPILITVIDYDTNKIILSSVSITKASRIINVNISSISNFLIGTKREYYQNKKTKKKYIFEINK